MNSRIFVVLFSTFQVLEIQVWNKFEFPIFIWYSQGLWSFLYFKLYWVWPSVIKHLRCCYMKILDLRFKYKSTISMKFLIFVWYSQFLWSYLNFKSYWDWHQIWLDLVGCWTFPCCPRSRWCRVPCPSPLFHPFCGWLCCSQAPLLQLNEDVGFKVQIQIKNKFLISVWYSQFHGPISTSNLIESDLVK